MTDDSPTVPEIAALTRRLRELSAAGRDADPDAVTRFLADKRALLDRIAQDTTPRAARRDAFRAYAVDDAIRELARARGTTGGYAQVGPSARTWHIDEHGRPTVEASEAEHRAVRSLLNTEELDVTEPAWVDRGDGQAEIVSRVVPAGSSERRDDDVPYGWARPACTPIERLPSCLGYPDERERREQLHRWDHDDAEAATSAHVDADQPVDEVPS